MDDAAACQPLKFTREVQGRARVQVKMGTAMVTIDTVIRMYNATKIRDRLMKIRRLTGNAACTATSRLISLKYQLIFE